LRCKPNERLVEIKNAPPSEKKPPMPESQYDAICAEIKSNRREADTLRRQVAV